MSDYVYPSSGPIERAVDELRELPFRETAFLFRDLGTIDEYIRCLERGAAFHSARHLVELWDEIIVETIKSNLHIDITDVEGENVVRPDGPETERGGLIGQGGY